MTNCLKVSKDSGVTKDLGVLAACGRLSDDIVSYKSGYFIDNFKGMEYWYESELVDNDMMRARGFDIVEVEGNFIASTGGCNKTVYFIHPDLSYVYVECFLNATGRYTRLIISKKVFNKYLSKKAIHINQKRTNNISVPAANICGKKDLHKLFGIVGEVDHISGSYNLIIDENLRGVSRSENNRNREQPYVVKNTKTGRFIVRMALNKRLVSDKDQDYLRQLDYEVVDTGIVNFYKEFKHEVDAIKGLRMIEERFYKEFAYSPINDMRGRFELKFQQLILGTITEDDVIKTVLKDYAMDAFSVHRYNLIPLCEKYGIPYNDGGEPATNGDLVNR